MFSLFATIRQKEAPKFNSTWIMHHPSAALVPIVPNQIAASTILSLTFDLCTQSSITN